MTDFGAEHIVVGVDAKDGLVAIEGWEKVSDKTATFTCTCNEGYRRDRLLCTLIYQRMACLSGPNVEQTKILSDKTGIDIIASGGMSCMDDLTHMYMMPVSTVQLSVRQSMKNVLTLRRL